jgi:hypothetical protein
MSDKPCIYLVGMNIPADTDAAGLAAFNEFYTRTHVPEVVANNPGFLSGTRYELLSADGAGPRFLAVYEVADEEAAKRFLERGRNPQAGRPTYTSGPPTWERHETLWRLMYRPIGP